MKSFEQFLESSSENVPPTGDIGLPRTPPAGTLKSEVSHTHHLRQIADMIDEKDERIANFVELNSELLKVFLEIKRTLEYGLKEESKIKEAVSKAIGLAEKGSKLRSSDFSSWSRMTRSGNHYSSKPE
jgi:hypothetical protein